MSDGRGLPYWVWFSTLAAISVGVLLVIVFARLPPRFVLAPGLREQWLNFPVDAPGFELPARTELLRPPPPEEVPPAGPAERFWSRVTALTEMGRDEMALRVLRDWVEEHPADHGARLEYARTLERTGRPFRAAEAYRRVAGATGSREARLALARLRWRLGDLEGALALYEGLVEERPGDRDVRRERADLLVALGRHREAARAYRALLEGAPGADEAAELRLRLARYRVWAGDDEGAIRALAALAREGSATADDLALLGDLLRWRGRRPEAAERYAQALARDADHGRALKGRRALREEVRSVVEERDPAGAGVESDLYLDSDDYRSWGAAGRAVLDPGWDADTHRLVARSGVRSVHGPSRSGPLREETGPVGGIGWIGWWRQATVRTALRVGAEHLESAGTEPVVGAELAVPGLGLEASYRHGPARPTTLTFASVQDQTRIDRVEASLFRPLRGGPWGLWTSLEAASVRGGGTDNGRLVAQAALNRPVALGGLLRAGYATRMLTTAEPAPVTDAGLSTYWSPALSWTHGLSLALDRPRDETGWGWHARVQPGASLVRLHGERAETDVEFSLFGEGGLEYRGERAVVRLQGEYVRSRLEGYEAFGASLGLTWRF